MENVKNNDTAHRFELEIDGVIAFVDYKLAGKQMTLMHTVVPPELGGQGVGGRIVKASLEFIKEKGLSVVAECPFVKHYIEQNKDYQNLMVDNH